MGPSLSYSQRHALASRCWSLATLFHTHDVRSSATSSTKGPTTAFTAALHGRSLPPAATPVGCNPITSMADKARDQQAAAAAAHKYKQGGLAAANGARGSALSKGAQGGLSSGGTAAVGTSGLLPHGSTSNPPPPPFAAQSNAMAQPLDSKTKVRTQPSASSPLDRGRMDDD